MIRNATLVAGLVLLSARLVTAQAPPPFVAKVGENGLQVLLHLNVNGKDRLVIIDSGSPSSTFDPRQWKGSEGQPYWPMDIDLGHSHKVSVSPYTQGRMAIYTDADPGEKPAALLGRDFLRQVVLMFDREEPSARLWPSSSVSARSVLAQLSPGAETPAHPWTVTKSLTEGALGLTMPLWIGSTKLNAEIDTGCPYTVVIEERMRSLAHWPYEAEDTVHWDQPIRELYSLVADMKTPFVEVSLANVADLTSNGECDAWIGQDLTNRGRWIMDVGHGLFAFQSYADQPLASIYLSGSSLILDKDGAFEMASDYTKPDTWDLDSINGKKPMELFGDLSKSHDHAAYARRMASELKTIASKSFKVKLRDGKKIYDMTYENRLSGTRASVAELAANQALAQATAVLKAVKPPTYADASGKPFHPDPLKGPMLLPAGTVFDLGEWKVSHTDRGSAVLHPPGWQATDGFEGTICIFRAGLPHPILVPLPAPGGLISVPRQAVFVAPSSWLWQARDGGGGMAFAPSETGAVGGESKIWSLAANGSAPEGTAPPSLHDSKALASDSLASVPSGWRVVTERNGLSVKQGLAQPPPARMATATGPNDLNFGPITLHAQAGATPVPDYIFVAPKGWAVERVPNGLIFLVGPSGTYGFYPVWASKKGLKL